VNKINIRITCLLAILIASFSTSYAQVLESKLWGPNGKDWDPAGRLPDFSYAGYHSSEKSLPSVPIVSDLSTTGALPYDLIDDTPALQGLINAQAALPINQRGAILIPQGRWIIDNQLILNVSGVVLRGAVNSAGKPISEFYFPNPTTGGDNQYHINMNGTISVTKIATVNANVPQGNTVLPITYSTAEEFKIGDYIQFTQDDNTATRSFSRYLNGDLDDAGASTYTTTGVYNNLFYTYAKVTAVTSSSITLDRPLPVKVQTDWFPTINKVNLASSTSEMGIENINFGSPNSSIYVHSNDPEPAYKYVKMSQVINCWIKNIVMSDLEVGILLTNRACFNTIKGVVFKQDLVNNTTPSAFEPSSTFKNRFEQQGLAGHHPVWIFNSFYNLVEDFVFEDVYWHELSVEGAAAFNVFRNGKGLAVAFDHHRLLPYANLFTNIDIGRPERMWWNSGSNTGTTLRGPNSGFKTTYWGITYTPVVPGLPIPVAKTDGFAFFNSIGVPGQTKATSPVDKVNSQYIEISGENEKVAQPDLFIAQLNRRKNIVGVKEILASNSTTKLYPNVINKGESINITRLETDQATITIYNIQGQKVYATTSTEKDIVIRQHDLLSGNYFVKVETGSSSTLLRFVVN
jgi:hypothetical protein